MSFNIVSRDCNGFSRLSLRYHFIKLSCQMFCTDLMPGGPDAGAWARAFTHTQQRVPRPSRVRCERAGLLADILATRGSTRGDDRACIGPTALRCFPSES